MLSPTIISDPSWPSHSVVVHPSQSAKVRLSYATVFNDVDCSIKSDFLELEEEFFQSGGKTFVFRQKYDLDAWADVSTTFLGEVSFHQDPNQEPINRELPNLCFFLESRNRFKKDIITAVNPHGGQTVKVYPHQILEVVVFNPIWGQELTWKYEPDGDNRMQLLASGVIDPTHYKVEECTKPLNDAFFTFPRIVQPSVQSYQEYHFWFRCNPVVAKVIKLFDDSYPVGELVFSGLVDGKVRAEHRIGVRLNDRQPKRPVKSRAGEVSFEDSAMDKGQTEKYPMPTMRPIDTWRSRLARQAVKATGGREIVPVQPNNSVIYNPAYGYDEYDPDEDYYRHGAGVSRKKMTKAERRAAKQAAKHGEIMGVVVQPDRNLPSHYQYKGGGNSTYQYKKPTERRTVVVRVKAFTSLEDGCRVLDHDEQLALPVGATPPKGATEVATVASKPVGTDNEVLQKIYEEMQAWD